ncbi:hypothetical protein G210_5871 [Candida maltosa Xu316]|uniref:F-box domain-containing protein n=1 Tax=Candida maltosa (strain Xu316) TaxID=1245528 RepID=M3IS47_CANMX|nr:hypothetical protein G210_5871 [Candida maltosa Xu316]
MADFQLYRLPLEILEIVVSYVPKLDLYKLDGIDYLRQAVLKNIYSSVIITGLPPSFSSWDKPEFAEKFMNSRVIERKPEFSCFKELIDFLDENHLPLPHHIYFKRAVDILLVYDKNPRTLQDCIIETSLDLFGEDENRDLGKLYLQKLISLPLKIRIVKNCEVLQGLIHESIDQFTRQLESASFSFKAPLETIFEGDRYQNLFNLEICFFISHDVVKLIPRSVKTLKFSIACPDFQVEDFGFPSALKSLNVSLGNYSEQYMLNFSSLRNLVNLDFYVTKNGLPIPFYNVTFPNSLRSVKSTGLDVDAIKSQCPEVNSFNCQKVRQVERTGNAVTFPEKLTHLYVDGGILANIEKVEDVQANDSKKRKIERTTHPNSIKLPKNLQSLYLDRGSYKVQFNESETLFSNKEENMLKNLKILSINYFDGFSRLGPLPQSLTQLTICSTQRMKSLNSDFFDNLKRITNLESLKIHCPLGPCFDYALPPKLQLFEFTNLVLSKISLRSESLRYLRLVGGKLHVGSPENVQLPESLVELHLINCGIDSFDELFTFSQSLEILNLNVQKVQKIPKLPPNLKNFYIFYGGLKTNQSDIAELSTTLEELCLHIASGPVTYSLTPDLTHLVNLKKLSFSSYRFNDSGVVNLDMFPESLTDLAITNCAIKSFTGTFTDFPYLANLDLYGNQLGIWLSQLPEEFMFDLDIRTIVLSNNYVDTETIKALIRRLRRYPFFKHVAVQSMSIPEDLQQTAIERYLIIAAK